MTSTPIDPATLDRDALMARFWRQQPGAPVAQHPIDIYTITYVDAAYMAGVSVTTIQNWLNSGIIPEGVYQWYGALRWLDRDRFEDWLAEHPERQRRKQAA